MMKRQILLTLAFALAAVLPGMAQWSIAGDRIRTVWAEQVTPENVWQEYPRPQMERAEWLNLNGMWNYAITSTASAKPAKFDGEILVPFAVESALSGVMRSVGANQALWYEREITVPSKWLKSRVLLNFGAVDWRADIYVNDILVGNHTGGYAPFSVDITPALKRGTTQRIAVRVWDPSDSGEQPVGKQRKEPKGIWYTPVTGIWQTVWLEAVPMANHIVSVVPECSAAKGELYLTTECADNSAMVDVEVLDGGVCVAKARTLGGVKAVIPVSGAKMWSPDAPFLYDLKVSISHNGKVVDTVKSYAAIRDIATVRDGYGHLRMTLNGKPIFMYGPLDQGWWPDGLYTAPSDEALRWDVVLTKRLGFNMIRKHIKVEPARWYYHCDREGIMVWQDMPSSNHVGNLWGRNHMDAGTDQRLSDGAKDNFYKEWGEIIDALRVYSSIVMWVPFNEAWGQFDTEEVAAWTKRRDASRLVNAASGGNLRECGDIIDIHNYPEPAMPVRDCERVVVLGEYGGIGRPVEGHTWSNDKNWGYIKLQSSGEVTDTYVKYAEKLKGFVPQGISSAIYTQTTDVEAEVNGFVTYDRRVEKMDFERVRKVNQEVIKLLE